MHHMQVYLVDFGLADRFNPEGRHKEYREDPRRAHDGTIEFTSIDAHKGASKPTSFVLRAPGRELFSLSQAPQGEETWRSWATVSCSGQVAACHGKTTCPISHMWLHRS